jgi:hypothetical protein
MCHGFVRVLARIRLPTAEELRAFTHRCASLRNSVKERRNLLLWIQWKVDREGRAFACG